MSQEFKIIHHLKTKGPITPLQALSEYGIMRLAARVEALRSKGHRIQTEIVRSGDKRYAKYRLIK